MKIQEIAEKAGVSTATVSRVFSHHPNIREELRARVFAVARECGYHPRLSTKQRNIVIVTPCRGLYPIQSYVEMVQSELANELAGRGYRIEMLPADNLERLDRIQFCGAVAIGVDESLFPAWDDRFAAPLILVDRAPARIQRNVYSVHSNETQAMELAIAHLAKHGCKKIGCIVYGKTEIGNVQIRLTGIRRALQKHALPCQSALLKTATEESYLEEIGKLLKLGVDALFCPGGNGGIITSYALSLYGKKVPEEISVIASERTVYSRFVTPPQTTISQDYPAQARAVADALDSCLEHRSFPHETIIEYHLIERESVICNV